VEEIMKDQSETSSPPFDATPFRPSRISLKSLANAAQSVEGCDLYKNATQAVFGEGPTDAPMILLGSKVLATYHPSAVLRAPQTSDRKRTRDEFFRDLLVAAKSIRSR
jgi:uracil-DNA glycosylase